MSLRGNNSAASALLNVSAHVEEALRVRQADNALSSIRLDGSHTGLYVEITMPVWHGTSRGTLASSCLRGPRAVTAEAGSARLGEGGLGLGLGFLSENLHSLAHQVPPGGGRSSVSSASGKLPGESINEQQRLPWWRLGTDHVAVCWMISFVLCRVLRQRTVVERTTMGSNFLLLKEKHTTSRESWSKIRRWRSVFPASQRTISRKISCPSSVQRSQARNGNAHSVC